MGILSILGTFLLDVCASQSVPLVSIFGKSWWTGLQQETCFCMLTHPISPPCFDIWQIVVDRLAAREVHLYAQTANQSPLFRYLAIVSTPRCFFSMLFPTLPRYENSLLPKAPKHHLCTNNTKRNKASLDHDVQQQQQHPRQ